MCHPLPPPHRTCQAPPLPSVRPVPPPPIGRASSPAASLSRRRSCIRGRRHHRGSDWPPTDADDAGSGNVGPFPAGPALRSVEAAGPPPPHQWRRPTGSSSRSCRPSSAPSPVRGEICVPAPLSGAGGWAPGGVGSSLAAAVGRGTGGGRAPWGQRAVAGRGTRRRTGRRADGRDAELAEAARTERPGGGSGARGKDARAWGEGRIQYLLEPYELLESAMDIHWSENE
ncbi:hypothetical protein BS78_02G094000 [Paspalum vaginatum]|nr:hypothetical protein BS78_02G094000 [Paspalum vaginatum]